MMSGVTQKDIQAVHSTLMSKICERRQESFSTSGRTTVPIADIVKLLPSCIDPNILVNIIRQFGEKTGFYEIVGKSIVLNKDGKHECNRLEGEGQLHYPDK
jgi:hypothetical protein